MGVLTLVGMSAKTMDSDEPVCKSNKKGYNLHGDEHFGDAGEKKGVKHTVASAEDISSKGDSGMSGLILGAALHLFSTKAIVPILVEEKNPVRQLDFSTRRAKVGLPCGDDVFFPNVFHLKAVLPLFQVGVHFDRDWNINSNSCVGLQLRLNLFRTDPDSICGIDLGALQREKKHYIITETVSQGSSREGETGTERRITSVQLQAESV